MSDNTHDPYKLQNLPTEFWPADKVKPYDKNTKIHDKEQVENLIVSIREFGLFDALIVDRDGVIIAGHGRFEALCKMGRVNDIPVKHAAHLTKNQADAARIAHNKTSSNEYQSDFMAEELRRLSEAGDVDMEALGLTEKELSFLTEDIGDFNDDALSVDLDADLDAQDAETDDKVEATDKSDVRLGEAFGFGNVPIGSVRSIRRLLAQAEQSTGKKGREAFVEWVDAL